MGTVDKKNSGKEEEEEREGKDTETQRKFSGVSLHEDTKPIG